ncbi:MAG TPA: hypothetical protein VFM07_07460 [Intrasporangium sp.]|nr:hypothetical protein [Intrasporangium sp.]
MFKRSIVRLVGTAVALVAGLAVTASAALAVNVPDPIGPIPGAGSGVDRLAPVAAPPDSLMILGMQWQLALAVGIFVIAGALFLASAIQRRHVVQI